MRRLITRTFLVVLVGALALLASGCISIKTQGAAQSRGTPGVVNLGGTVCVSDYDANTYTTCQPSTPIAELDNCRGVGTDCGFTGGDGDDSTSDRTGQLLVAFRVPNGANAPESFKSDDLAHTFDQNVGYTDAMNERYTAVRGEHWVGYASGFLKINPHDTAGDREISFHAEFGLPTAANGGPFPGQLKWRMAVGFRQIADQSQVATPVSCTDFLVFCADSPPNAPPAFPADFTKSVSDFGVLAGSRGVAGQAGRATVTFPVKYVDAGGLGARNLSLTASTTLPGGTATPGATTMRITPGATSTMNVTVSVPDAAPLGDYKVTLTASNGSPATTRSNTATITVTDQVAPGIRISTPPNGSSFRFGSAVAADYGCQDQANASGVRSCTGPVANGARIDTGSLGPKVFTVNASDNAGNASAATSTYTVKPRPAPAVSMPFSYSRFKPKTTLILLQVKGVPKGSTLTVKCKGKRCPVRKRFRKANTRKKNFTLRRFFPRSYPPGTMIEARVSKTGSVTAIRRTIIRKNKRPIPKKLCLAPGAKTPKRC